MKLTRVTRLAVFYQPEESRRIRVGRIALASRDLLFEYDPAFIARKLEISPFHLPLAPGVTVGDPAKLDGLMGVFDDSLPDGWGRLLIDRRAAQLGFSADALTPLDRLALVGARSMGALVYEPEVELDEPTVLELSDLAQEVEIVLRHPKAQTLERLIAAGGSPKGARPKALVQIGPDGQVLFGARHIEPGFTAWLVKFPAPTDDANVASLEHAYFLMARQPASLFRERSFSGPPRKGPATSRSSVSIARAPRESTRTRLGVCSSSHSDTQRSTTALSCR